VTGAVGVGRQRHDEGHHAQHDHVGDHREHDLVTGDVGAHAQVACPVAAAERPLSEGCMEGAEGDGRQDNGRRTTELAGGTDRHPAQRQEPPVPAGHVDLGEDLPAAVLDGVESHPGLVVADVGRGRSRRVGHRASLTFQVGKRMRLSH
jgi:hypothetical protein